MTHSNEPTPKAQLAMKTAEGVAGVAVRWQIPSGHLAGAVVLRGPKHQTQEALSEILGALREDGFPHDGEFRVLQEPTDAEKDGVPTPILPVRR